MRSLPGFVKKRIPTNAVLAWRHWKARRTIEAYEKRSCFAEEAVDLKRLKLFRRESFPDSGPTPWLDRPDASTLISRRLDEGEITEAEAALCRKWRERGYLIFKGHQKSDRLDRIWAAVERAVESGDMPVALDLKKDGAFYEERILNLHRHVPELEEVLRDEATLGALRLLLGREIRPFQTIAFHTGSEQSEHSDSVHMTTYPEGYLAATWTAMEDIHPESGVLVYYPGSHRLPTYLSRDVGIGVRETLEDIYRPYTEKYEPFIQELIRREDLEPVFFTPKKGDMLIWHANLLHGGTARRDRALSRKSVVCHYFARDAICYHDISASLAPPGS